MGTRFYTLENQNYTQLMVRWAYRQGVKFMVGEQILLEVSTVDRLTEAREVMLPDGATLRVQYIPLTGLQIWRNGIEISNTKQRASWIVTFVLCFFSLAPLALIAAWRQYLDLIVGTLSLAALLFALRYKSPSSFLISVGFIVVTFIQGGISSKSEFLQVLGSIMGMSFLVFLGYKNTQFLHRQTTTV